MAFGDSCVMGYADGLEFRMNTPYDQEAIEILFSMYWSGKGWKIPPNRRLSRAQREIGEHFGVLHDDVCFGHDDLLAALFEVRAKVEPQQVAQAFLASLSTRNLTYRSALGSYAASAWMPEHHFASRQWCPVCGGFHRPRSKEDLNELNFERIKWGGVRHDDPLYAWFDLNEYLKLPSLTPTETDRIIFREILRTAQAIPPQARIRELEKAISKLLPSSKNERENLLHILGFCGILAPPDKPGFFREYGQHDDRERREGDWEYPVEWWQGKHGVNREAVAFYFPGLDF